MNKLIISIFILIASIQSFAQTKVDEKTKVKNYVINQSKNGLEFPKYYKTEKITLELTFKGKSVNIAYGANIDKVEIHEKPKYFNVKVENLLGIGLQKDKLYKINKLVYDTQYAYYTIFYKKSNNLNDSFIYEGSSDIDLFTKQSFITYLDTEYKVNIWYWAMSKGGTVRLYNDLGTAYVNNKGSVSYIVDEPVE